MTVYVAFLRAVNVGGYGKLAMRDLAELAADCGFRSVKTYIQSGNLVFSSELSQNEVKAALKAALKDFVGAEVPVLVRMPQELRNMLSECPFREATGNRVGFVIADEVDPDEVELRGTKDEEVVFGGSAIFVHFPSGMGASRLKFAGLSSETMRNRNTVEKMAALASELEPQP